jgi:hypothetical protein
LRISLDWLLAAAKENKFTRPKSNGFDIGQMPVTHYRPSRETISRVAIGHRNT